MGTRQGKKDASTLFLLKYLRSSVTTEFESSSKLYVVFFLCLILSFVSKFFQPFKLRKYFFKVLGFFSGPLHFEVMRVCHAQCREAAEPLKYLNLCPGELMVSIVSHIRG